MRRLLPDPAEVDDVDALVAAEARPAPVDRPWLLVNMVTSLDGAISIDGRSGPLAAPADKAVFLALRGIADVILAGAGTVRAEGYGPPRPTAGVRADRLARGQAEVPRLAVVTRSLDLDLAAPLFTDAVEPPLVLTCGASDPTRRAEVAEVAEVVVTGDVDVDLPAALGRLREDGVAVVTCEGGAVLNGQLIAADLVDEWDLTLSPLLAGGDSGRSSRWSVPPPPRSMRLDRVLEGDGLLLTRWVRATR